MKAKRCNSVELYAKSEEFRLYAPHPALRATLPARGREQDGAKLNRVSHAKPLTARESCVLVRRNVAAQAA